jgi:hypothetical protein
MKPFAPTKRKLTELLILGGLTGIFYFFVPRLEAIVLFVFGFIWNWSASVELDPLYEHRSYRFSMLTTVRSLQNLFLKPFTETPFLIQRFISILPAGIFWWMIVYINESMMPWWAPFIGSAAFELTQMELKLIKGEKEGT